MYLPACARQVGDCTHVFMGDKSTSICAQGTDQVDARPGSASETQLVGSGTSKGSYPHPFYPGTHRHLRACPLNGAIRRSGKKHQQRRAGGRYRQKQTSSLMQRASPT